MIMMIMTLKKILSRAKGGDEPSITIRKNLEGRNFEDKNLGKRTSTLLAPSPTRFRGLFFGPIFELIFFSYQPNPYFCSIIFTSYVFYYSSTILLFPICALPDSFPFLNDDSCYSLENKTETIESP